LVLFLWGGLFQPIDIVKYILDRCYSQMLIFFFCDATI
jgi:hypothetical protein